MNANGSGRVHAGVWIAVGLLLLAWNGVLCSLASPFVLQHRLDGVQYQLLARNRLLGHYDVNDRTHTVGTEGRNPIWRPGLVWVEEGLARCLGSVHHGAAAASALGTTFLELALLGLAWRCYGRKTVFFMLLALLVPEIGAPFLECAVGQGPEVWAAAASVAGLAILVEGIRRRSLGWALTAGTFAGAAEWFRTGNVLLFAVPCAVYALVYLWQRDRRGFALPAGALLAWVGMAALGGLAVPSTVNKTIANLWACRTDLGGPSLTEELADGSHLTSSLIGYTLVPGTEETYLDHSLRGSCGRSTLAYCREHAAEITHAYGQHLEEVVTSGFRGLRQKVGGLVLTLFSLQLLLCLGCCREQHTPALAGAVLAQYLGPVVLIAGNEPTQYLLVAYPFFALVATRGAVALVDLVTHSSERGCVSAPSGKRACISAPIGERGALAPRFCESSGGSRAPRVTLAFVVGLAALLIVFRSIPFYEAAVTQLAELHQQALQEQAAIDALDLNGRRVACRNMGWFVDRNVQTVFLPYARVPELESYLQAHGADGILIWEQEPMAAFRANPYGTPLEFGRALQDSGRFGPPQVSGAWRWYPHSILQPTSPVRYFIMHDPAATSLKR